MKTREVVRQELAPQSDRIRPKVIKWKKVPMLRAHSFLASVREIINFSDEIDVVKVGLIGDQHSGKTTLAQAIAHAIHLGSKVPFTIRIFEEKDLLDFEATLKNLRPANYILIFDDVSFMGAKANKKQIEIIKAAITKIRHLEGGQDVKIILIYNYHYTLGFDKYLRQADFKYFTTIGSSEVDNLLKEVGGKYASIVSKFQAQRRRAVGRKYWTVNIGPKESLAYRYRNPFIPVLFWNNESLRPIVTPRRQFMDEICTICDEAAGEAIAAGSIPEFCEQGENNFGLGNFQSAIKLLLHTHGLTVHGKHVVQALRFIERARLQKNITLEQLAAYYGMEITRTKLRKKPDLKD